MQSASLPALPAASDEDWAGSSVRGNKAYALAREQLLARINGLTVELEGPEWQLPPARRDPGTPLPLITLTEEDKAEVAEYKKAIAEKELQEERKQKSDELLAEKKRLDTGKEEKRLEKQIMQRRLEKPDFLSPG